MQSDGGVNILYDSWVILATPFEGTLLLLGSSCCRMVSFPEHMYFLCMSFRSLRPAHSSCAAPRYCLRSLSTARTLNQSSTSCCYLPIICRAGVAQKYDS